MISSIQLHKPDRGHTVTIEDDLADNLKDCPSEKRVELLTDLYKKTKHGNFYGKKIEELTKKYKVKTEKLLTIKKIILSIEYGMDFNPEKHKQLLLSTLIEMQGKALNGFLYKWNNFRCFLVSSFNAKLIEQNQTIQHISCSSIFQYLRQSNICRQENLRKEIIDKIDAVASEITNLQANSLKQLDTSCNEEVDQACPVVGYEEIKAAIEGRDFVLEWLSFGKSRPAGDEPPAKKNVSFTASKLYRQ